MRYNFYLDTFFDENLIYFLSRKLSIKTEIGEGIYKKVLASSLYQNKFEEDFLENIKQKALCTNNKSFLIYSFEIKKWKDIKKGFTHFKNGDIVIAKITPCFQNRKSAIIKNLPNNIGAGTTELHVIREDTNILIKKYLLLIFKTELFIKNGIKNFTGTAGQQRVGKEYISNYLIPLPPLAEQKRIVAKVDELMKIVDKLEFI